MSEQTPTFQPGTPLTITACANGFVVREAYPDFGSGRAMSNECLVFNHMRAGLLAFLEQHFESEADRERRLEAQRTEVGLQRMQLDAMAAGAAACQGTVFAGFPPITGCNPAPFDGSLLKAYACAGPANGLPLCRKWCGNEVLCLSATSDAGKPA